VTTWCQQRWRSGEWPSP